VILKGEAQEIKRYIFPLSREQIAEIHKTIGICFRVAIFHLLSLNYS